MSQLEDDLPQLQNGPKRQCAKCVKRQHAKNVWKDNLPKEGFKDNFQSHKLTFQGDKHKNCLG